MPPRVSPTEPNPTHDISLRDRNGLERGFLVSESNGARPEIWKPKRIPIERTALKTTSGNSQYSDLDYPYSPIVQDDWSGGRGLRDFERDNTRFFDSYRMRTGRANKAFLGPQEQYTTGIRIQDQVVPGDVKWIQLSGETARIFKPFTPPTGYTTGRVEILLRRVGNPQPARIAVMLPSAGEPDTVNPPWKVILVPPSRLPDIVSERLSEEFVRALTGSQPYYIEVSRSVDTGLAVPVDDQNNHWEVGVSPTPGDSLISSLDIPSVFSAASFDLYFRLTDATEDKTCLMVDYKEQHYAFISPATGAPKVYEIGDRGAADANTGTLNKLIDATKSWVVNEHAGAVVKITDGPGKQERVVWRTVVSNTATELVVTPSFTIEHTVLTEYVLLNKSKWREITGHGLTAPVTDVLVSRKGVIYVAMGDAVTVQRLQAYNDAGTWRHFDDALCHAAETAATKATFFAYLPQNDKIVMGANADAAGDVSVAIMSNGGGPPAWGTALTWGTAIPVGSRYRKMNRLEVYPDDGGAEAIYVLKVDRPWIVRSGGAVYPMALREMESVKSSDNATASLVHNVYLYFPIGAGLERYYNGQLDDIGPNLGEGLPVNRRGLLIYFAGYPGRFFAAVDGGATGYSSILAREGSGWHEHYRAPKGQRITCLSFQTIPGTALDRMWAYVGNDLIWLPFPSVDTNELGDPNMLYTPEGSLELSRMHAGMFDVQKIAAAFKLWAENLDKDVCWIEVDYRLDSDVAYTSFPVKFEESPLSTHNLKGDANTPLFGITAQEFQLRLRFFTSDASKTPVLMATILEAVMRISVKFLRPLLLLVEDNQLCLDGTADDQADAMAKLDELDTWASDKSEGMLLMRSRSRLFDGQMVFLNPVGVDQVGMRDPQKPEARDRFVLTTSAQDA